MEARKPIHLRNVDVNPSTLISPERMAILSDEEREEIKEQFFTDIMYGTSPQNVPLRKTFATLSEVRTPRDQDSPKTAQMKKSNRGANINDMLKEISSTELTTESSAFPKFQLPLDKVAPYEAREPVTPRSNSARYVDTPRPESKQLKTSFDLLDILADPLCREHFSAFLRMEYCEECMLFYENWIVFKTWKNRRQRLTHAKEIYAKFVSTDAPQQINTDIHSINAVAERIASKYSSIFMKLDS